MSDDSKVCYWLCCGSTFFPHEKGTCREAQMGHPERVRWGTAQQHSEWQKRMAVPDIATCPYCNPKRLSCVYCGREKQPAAHPPAAPAAQRPLSDDEAGVFNRALRRSATVVAEGRKAEAPAAQGELVTDAEQAALYEYLQGTPHYAVMRRLATVGVMPGPTEMEAQGDARDADTERLDWLEQQGLIGIDSLGYGDFRHYAGKSFGPLRAVVDKARGK